MNIIERIEQSFENGEDFNIMANDVKELKELNATLALYEHALKTIGDMSPLKYQLADAQHVALLACNKEEF